MIFNNITETIGKTPLVKLNRLIEDNMADVYVKIESFNPTSSIKDRAALYIVNAAEQKGLLKPGDTLIEPTSGNTGIGLAMIGAARGYNVILVMPDSMSVERQRILKAYGAKILLTEGKDGMTGSIQLAETLVKKKGYFMPNQFSNKANTQAHIETTAQEIYEDTNGNIDVFVAGVGTGGTISGVGKRLKTYNPNIKIIAIEPKASPFLSQNKPSPHKIQGIGPNFVPDIVDMSVIDEIIHVSNEDAYDYARRLATEEGILAGISSGANVSGALKLAKKLGKGKIVVTVLPDTGERYLSTDLFKEEKNND